MFARGAVPGRVMTWSYDEDDEDFTRGVSRLLKCVQVVETKFMPPEDASELDVWVHNRVEDLFANATIDKALDSQLRDTEVVFFLHLLGLDTTGHAYRPHSKVSAPHRVISLGCVFNFRYSIGIHA